MKQLWAPWRMSYISRQDKQEQEGCIFCLSEAVDTDRERLVLFRGRYAYIIMNKYPYSNGHLMVAPFQHTADLGSLSDAEAVDMHRLTILARDVLSECFAPQGFNVGMNWGGVAGAGVRDHLHQHIVPRWQGDTNFMPVFGDVRVIPQHLEETYELLAAGLGKLAGEYSPPEG